jgi:hypothetical protein
MLSFIDMNDVSRALKPLEVVVTALGGLMVFLTLVMIPLIVFGSGSFLGFGNDEVCVSLGADAAADLTQGHNALHVAGAADGVSAAADGIALCQSDPTPREQFLDAGNQGVAFLFVAGLLLLLWLALRDGRQRGLFVEPFARRLGGLGLYVLLGELVVSIVHAWTRWQLTESMVPNGSASGSWSYSWTALLVGFGLITICRVMSLTVPMRAELDATI